jgi:septal ring factor EnvC (AmiA/AmiB activator)
MKLVVLIAAVLASASPAFAQSCEDQRDMYREIIQNLRNQRAVTEVDLGNEMSRLRREKESLARSVTVLQEEIAKLKATKPAEKKPEPPKVDGGQP